VRFVFHERFMVESGHFEAESLAATAGAQFDC
jgi:hypothetical protein